MMVRPFDVVVVGGGIVGSNAAYRLVRSGLRVALVDRGDPGYATGAGAGIIAPGTTHTTPPAYFPLAFAATGHFDELLNCLAEDGEDRPGYSVIGSLFVATNETEAERIPDILNLAVQRRAAGVHHIGDVYQITGSEAQKLSPALARVASAIYCTGSARMDARVMTSALRRAATRRGLQTITGSAELLVQDQQVTGVKVNGDKLLAASVIISAGAWSSSLVNDLGLVLPVSPQRGQIAHLNMPNVRTGDWPIITGFHGHYQLTFPENRVVVGATRESDAGYDDRVTAGGVREVLDEALRVSPGLAVATLHDVRVGLRPATADGLPILGRASRYQNVYFATGHGASGLQLGPYSGALIADLIQGLSVDVDLAPYSVERFQPSTGSDIG